MQVFSTADVPPARRAAYWNATYEQFARVRVRPISEAPFQAELRLARVGPLEIALVHSDRAIAERTGEHTAAAEKRQFGIIVLLEGEGVWDHCGRREHMRPGDILVSDNTKPMSCYCEKSVRTVTVRASEALLRAHMPFVDEICGQRLPADSGLVRAAAAIATCLSEQSQLNASLEYETTIANHFLDVVATSYAAARKAPHNETSVAGLRKALARRFIETNLASPDLTPQRMADALQISPRYLRMLMAEDGETASTVILRRRLEECARQLANPMWRDRTITHIAFAWGFNSTAHFARVFRNKYGMSPREYRQMAVEACLAPAPAHATATATA